MTKLQAFFRAQPHATAGITAPLLHILLSLALLLTLTGCGLFAAEDEYVEPSSIRTAKPTFTPTSVSAQAPASTDANQSSDTQGQPTPEVPFTNTANTPKAVINGPIVNARTGPGTEFDIIGEVERGNEFEIIGISPDREWWQICCVNDSQAWITSEFVDTIGMVDSVPVIGPSGEPVAPQASAPNTPEPTQAPTAPEAPTATPEPAVTFNLEAQEQFPETAFVRVFLYVYTGNNALEGYSLRVSKDGSELPVEGSSFGGQPAFTWPFQDPRQRFQNFKAEFPDTPAQGVWQVQLVNSDGALVGAPAIFTLTANDPQQELYVRYAQR